MQPLQHRLLLLRHFRIVQKGNQARNHRSNIKGERTLISESTLGLHMCTAATSDEHYEHAQKIESHDSLAW